MTATQYSDADDVLALATRFFGAIEACDMELVRAIYATDARAHLRPGPGAVECSWASTPTVRM